MKVVRVQKTVAARELPKARREESRFAPDQRMTVVIEPEDADLLTLHPFGVTAILTPAAYLGD